MVESGPSSPPFGREQRPRNDQVPATPWGEQLDYKGPTTLAGYATFTDATSARDDNEPRPKSDKCGTARRYRVGPRADMRTVIKPILKELGLCEVDEPQADHLEQAQMNWEVRLAVESNRRVAPPACALLTPRVPRYGLQAPWVKPKKASRSASQPASRRPASERMLSARLSSSGRSCCGPG